MLRKCFILYVTKSWSSDRVKYYITNAVCRFFFASAKNLNKTLQYVLRPGWCIKRNLTDWLLFYSNPKSALKQTMGLNHSNTCIVSRETYGTNTALSLCCIIIHNKCSNWFLHVTPTMFSSYICCVFVFFSL